MGACAFSASAALPGAPELNGLTPKTATGWINGTNGVHNPDKCESLSVDIVNNGNVIVGWENDGGDINSFLGVWTLLDPNGKMITPQTLQTNRDMNGDLTTLESTTNQYLSFFRSDNTPTPGWPGGWGPKVRANPFGNGMGMQSMSWAIGLEVPELFDINEDAGGIACGGGVACLASSDDFPLVQLLNNNGTPLRLGPIVGITNLGIVTLADADVQPAGPIRTGGWDYLSSGNILIVGESRQVADRALTGQPDEKVPVYRIVTPAGLQVKGYSAVSAAAVGGSVSRQGAAATANGFAIRWQEAGTGATGVKVRLFDNAGTPTSVNLDLAAVAGHLQANGGGDGSGAGLSSNGKDAYVLVGDYSTAVYGSNGVWVTVLNANGTLRWSRDVASDLVVGTISGSSAAIDESGQVVVVFSASPDAGAGYATGVMGRRFDAAGTPVGGTFYISEVEVPDGTLWQAIEPKVAWRNGKIAVAWVTRNYPDPSLNNQDVVAYRLFVASTLPGAPENNGLTPKTTTAYINGTNGVNNMKTQTLGVGVANNGNVMVAWEDDGASGAMDDIESVWTMFDANGNWLTPDTKISSISLGLNVTNKYLSFIRPDNSAAPGYISWGPHIHANLFGDGIGHGASSQGSYMALEFSALAGYTTANGGFPVVQLFDNSGAQQSAVLTGATESYASRSGSIRMGDWEYLANGNIVIVGWNRQASDLVDLYGGASSGPCAIYRVLTAAGEVVKPEALVSDTPFSGELWRGVGAAKDGFAVRFFKDGAANVRMFDNNGVPTTPNLSLATLTGRAEAAGGGRGEGIGFTGNGNDAYVHGCAYSQGFWVTVLNANGTVRWTRDVSDDMPILAGGVDGGDVAINEAGEVIAVFSAKLEGYPAGYYVTMGRRFDATGCPLGGTFYVSEKEVPNVITPPEYARNPRVAWRNGTAAVIWESQNYPYEPLVLQKVVAQRYFLTVPPSLSITRSGSTVTISWAPGVPGYTLESSLTASPTSWSTVGGVVNNSVSVGSPTGNKFYRLKK